jgi:hypothetical protein
LGDIVIAFCHLSVLPSRCQFVHPSALSLSALHRSNYQWDFNQTFSTIPSCALNRHTLLRCTKWPPELKIEKSCPTFEGHTTGGISAKLYRSDQYLPLLCTFLTCSSFLHKMATRAKNRKILSGLHRSNNWWDFNQTLPECSVPSLLVHITCMFRFVAQNGRQSYK